MTRVNTFGTGFSSWLTKHIGIECTITLHFVVVPLFSQFFIFICSFSYLCFYHRHLFILFTYQPFPIVSHLPQCDFALFPAIELSLPQSFLRLFLISPFIFLSHHFHLEQMFLYTELQLFQWEGKFINSLGGGKDCGTQEIIQTDRTRVLFAEETLALTVMHPA
jgi:hypothetical protein